MGKTRRRADQRDSLRRAPQKLVPLVYQSFNWQHGTFLGATLASETTAAATGAVGRGAARSDGDAAVLRLQHGRLLGRTGYRWRKRATNPPKIFRVNWFQRNDQGKFIWPGFGENLRVLRWVIERSKGGGEADETPIGYVPKASSLERRRLERVQVRSQSVGRGRSRGLEK